MSECPPLLSVNEEVEDHGAVFLWDRKDGARATLADGTTVYMPTSRTNVPELDGHVTADANQWTETPELEELQIFHCSASLASSRLCCHRQVSTLRRPRPERPHTHIAFNAYLSQSTYYGDSKTSCLNQP
jgi:hypothetical protein